MQWKMGVLAYMVLAFGFRWLGFGFKWQYYITRLELVLEMNIKWREQKKRKKHDLIIFTKKVLIEVLQAKSNLSIQMMITTRAWLN